MTNGKDLVYPNGFNSATSSLTKEELFAAMAMQGLLANPKLTHIEDVTVAMTAIDAMKILIECLNK